MPPPITPYDRDPYCNEALMRANAMPYTQCKDLYDARDGSPHGTTFETYEDAANGAHVGSCILFIADYSTYGAGDMLWSNDDDYYQMCDATAFSNARCLCLAPPSTPPLLPPPPSPSPPVPLTPDVSLVHALRDGSWTAVLDVAANTLTNIYLLDQGERGPVVEGDVVVYVIEATETCAADAASKPYDDLDEPQDHGGIVYKDAYKALYVSVRLPEDYYRLCYYKQPPRRRARSLQVFEAWTATEAFLRVSTFSPPPPSPPGTPPSRPSPNVPPAPPPTSPPPTAGWAIGQFAESCDDACARYGLQCLETEATGGFLDDTSTVQGFEDVINSNPLGFDFISAHWAANGGVCAPETGNHNTGSWLSFVSSYPLFKPVTGANHCGGHIVDPTTGKYRHDCSQAIAGNVFRRLCYCAGML